MAQMVGLYADQAPVPQGPPGSDKIGHLLGFAAPAFVAVLLRSRWALGLLVVHALVSEPLQGWLAPLRTPDPLDTLADLVGIALGAGVAMGLRRARERSSGKMGV